MKIEKLRDELAHKERTIGDLISFIQIRNSDNRPNYALFLGAGASVTSGIFSGQQLIDTWRKEIYTRLKGCDSQDISKDELIDYFKQEEGSWYNPNNEYSSLFEKKFDLASQRRRFVESQVDKKLPSIGYAYLASLVNTNYFNTVFTTNFDDLINEAFYQFATSRPYMCAHDSSIREITLSSDRPKIIKLHGDYLFDDIKSTLRETESLESNIREKLIESTSELGLIVMGYSGCDRSIIDVLNYLLKSDNHLKNGIYWCIRSGDEINQEVRKLLWKEKAYFVCIDGFDEAMAEIHHGILKELSLKENFINSKKEAIIDNFTKDCFSLKDRNQFIKKDIEKIRKHKESIDISNLLREVTEDSKNGISKQINETDLKNLLNIDKLVKDGSFDLAKSSAVELARSSEDAKTKIIYLQRVVSINKKLNLLDAAHSISDEIIELDRYNSSHVISKSLIYKSMEDRYNYLIKCADDFKHSFTFLNFIVKTGLKLLKYNSKRLNHDISIEKLQEYTETSLRLDPSLDNSAWLLKLDLIQQCYTDKCDERSIKEKNNEYDAVLAKAESINNKHLTYFEIKHLVTVRTLKHESYLDLANELITQSKQSSLHQQSSLVSIACNVYIDIFNCGHNIDFKQNLKDLLESDYIQKSELKIEPAILHLNMKYSISVAKDINNCSSHIDKLINCSSAEDYAENIVGILCKVLNQPDKALEFVNANSDKLVDHRALELKSEIAISMRDIKAIQYLDEAKESGLSFDCYCLTKMFAYLVLDKFFEAEAFYNENKSDIQSKEFSDMMLLNAEYAKKRQGKVIDMNAVRNVNSRGLSPYLKLASLCLQEQQGQAKHQITNLIEQDFNNYYTFKSWPIIPDKYINDFAPHNQMQLVC